MRELTDEEKRAIENNIDYLGEEFKAFYNDYIAVNKELGFRCNSVETYDYQDRWVSEIKIKKCICCYDITTNKFKDIFDIAEYRKFLLRHIELKKKKMLEDKINEIEKDFE
jgi:hypothetical protein